MIHRNKAHPPGRILRSAGLRTACAAVLLAWTAAACIVTAREPVIAGWYAQVEGRTVTFEEDLFKERVFQTGLWKPARFEKVIGFGIFETGPEPGGPLGSGPPSRPVLLVHGHLNSPAAMTTVGQVLQNRGLTPLFAYYATGEKLDLSAQMMESAVAAFAAQRGIEELPVVAYSMGGLVARKFLGNRHGSNEKPRVPLFISLATPYGGIEVATNWKHKPRNAPASWTDMSCGQEFLKHLYDDPLPEDTDFYLLYGVVEDKTSKFGPGDGTVSEKSATRKDAAGEATEVIRFDVCDHRVMPQKKEPLAKVREILEAYYDAKATGVSAPPEPGPAEGG